MIIPKLIAGTSNPTVTYDISTKKSTFAKPVGIENANQLIAFDPGESSRASSAVPNVGRYGKITRSGSNLVLDGDWTGESFCIGYEYTMEVVLPTFYYTAQVGTSFRSDTRSNLILHRVKLGLGPIGAFQATVSRRGKTDYIEDFEVTPADAYLSNAEAITDESTIKTIPIYDRNTNAVLTLKSAHPTPANMLNVTWEGVLNNNFYQRV